MLNLDMVGQNQQACGSAFVVERPPVASSSFAADLLERLREEWMGEVPNLAGLVSYPLFRYASSPFSGGSDHYILSDPSVGVSTPMLIQWPDKFYHTSEDTLDKVDPHTLAVVGGLATAYAYFVASAGSQEARWLGHEMNARFRVQLTRSVQNGVSEALATAKAEDLAAIMTRIEKHACFFAGLQRMALHSLLRLAPQEKHLVARLQDEVDLAVPHEIERARAILLEHAHGLGLSAIPETAAREPDESERKAATLVPQRLFRGPVSVHDYLYRLTPQEREEARGWFKQDRDLYGVVSTSTDYWIDGKRTAAEIVDLVELETGKRDVQLVLRHLHLMDRLGLVSLQVR
jgi:hypothetical protein